MPPPPLSLTSHAHCQPRCILPCSFFSLPCLVFSRLHIAHALRLLLSSKPLYSVPIILPSVFNLLIILSPYHTSIASLIYSYPNFEADSCRRVWIHLGIASSIYLLITMLSLPAGRAWLDLSIASLAYSYPIVSADTVRHRSWKGTG